ncbi:unnamed protein product [Lathyrus sativus]|nr:unnamed protein product [Lathyrus sativus]
MSLNDSLSQIQKKSKGKSNGNVSSSRPKNCSQTPQSQCDNVTITPHMDVTSRHVSLMFELQPMMPVGKLVTHQMHVMQHMYPMHEIPVGENSSCFSLL